MDKGAAILWNKNDTKRRSTQIEQITETEATNPTPLASRKRKRHPEERKQSTLARNINVLMKLRKGMMKFQQKKLKK